MIAESKGHRHWLICVDAPEALGIVGIRGDFAVVLIYAVLHTRGEHRAFIEAEAARGASRHDTTRNLGHGLMEDMKIRKGGATIDIVTSSTDSTLIAFHFAALVALMSTMNGGIPVSITGAVQPPEGACGMMGRPQGDLS